MVAIGAPLLFERETERSRSKRMSDAAIPAIQRRTIKISIGLSADFVLLLFCICIHLIKIWGCNSEQCPKFIYSLRSLQANRVYYSKHLHRLFLALYGDRWHFFRNDFILHQLPRILCEQDVRCERLVERFRSACKVHRVSNDRIFHAFHRTNLTGNDGTRVYAAAYSHRRLSAKRPLLVEFNERVAHHKRRLYRIPRVTFHG